MRTLILLAIALLVQTATFSSQLWADTKTSKELKSSTAFCEIVIGGGAKGENKIGFPAGVALTKIYKGEEKDIPVAFGCPTCQSRPHKNGIMPGVLVPALPIGLTMTEVTEGLLATRITCPTCGTPVRLWEMPKSGPPKYVATMARLERQTDKDGKKFVEIPTEWVNQARSSGGYFDNGSPYWNSINGANGAAWTTECRHCGTTTVTNEQPSTHVDCAGCGVQLAPEDFFDAKEAYENWLAAQNSPPAVAATRQAAVPENPARSTTRAPRGPKLSTLLKGASVLAVSAVIGGGVYYNQNNFPVIGTGYVVSIAQNNQAIVTFSEGAVWNPDRTTYQVNLNIKDMQSTPGYNADSIRPGDPVQVYYTWADMHYLSFAVNPYLGAESLRDGSVFGADAFSN